MSLVIGLEFAPQLPATVRQELEQIMAALQAWANRSDQGVSALSSQLAANSIKIGTLATQPVLSAADIGYIFFVTDYGHMVYWTGSAWDWLDGDRPGKFQDFAIDPGIGYQLCDGSITNYLSVGPTLTAIPLATPNLTGTPAYKKSAATYTGAIVAAAGASGSSGAGISGTTATESSHTHNVPRNTDAFQDVAGPTLGVQASLSTHTHTTDAGSAHSHGVGSLAADAHTHGIGSLDPAHLNVLPYFRR